MTTTTQIIAEAQAFAAKHWGAGKATLTDAMQRRADAGLRVGDIMNGNIRYAGGNTWEQLSRENGEVVKTVELPEGAKHEALVSMVANAGRFGFGG